MRALLASSKRFICGTSGLSAKLAILALIWWLFLPMKKMAKRKNPGSDVDYGEDRAPMRRLGPTGLNARPRLARRGGRGPVAHEDHCARQWDQGGLDRVWITDFTYLRCAQGWRGLGFSDRLF